MPIIARLTPLFSHKFVNRTREKAGGRDRYNILPIKFKTLGICSCTENWFAGTYDQFNRRST